MKTLLEWLESFPEPYKEKAIANCKKISSEEMLITKCPSLSNALISAFSWSETQEGFEYWNKLHNYFLAKEELQTP